jgi:hypothetical protein
MLEDLDKIDWKTYKAAQIPDWIRTLLISEDRDDWQEAFTNLSRCVNPGSEADPNYGNPESFRAAVESDLPYLVVPFLIELLAPNLVLYPSKILRLLFELTMYKESAQVFATALEDEFYRLQADKIYQAIRQGIPVYQISLQSKFWTVSSAAQDLLDYLEVLDRE